MKGYLIVSLLSALSFSSFLFEARSATAQFSTGEIVIIQREWHKDNGDLNPFPIPPIPRKMGGSGASRWAVLELQKDEWGNKYFLNTKDVHADQGSGERDRFVSYTVQVFYSNPSKQGGALLREVKFYGKCQGIVSLVALQESRDLSKTGAVVRREAFNESLREPKGREAKDLGEACFQAYVVPYYRQLLERGRGRSSDY